MAETDITKHQCQRCGRCCAEVGRTFWKHGNLFDMQRPFGEIEELNRRALNGDHQDDGRPCEMLEPDGRPDMAGLFVCRIHRQYGKDAKPAVCQTYPEPGESCFRESDDGI